jgi:hypothetical protein
MAFAVVEPARHALSRPTAGPLDDAYSGFTHVADRTVAPAPLRTRPFDRARGLRYRGPRHLPAPDSHRQVALNLSLVMSCRTPFLHGAEQSRRTRRQRQQGGGREAGQGGRSPPGRRRVKSPSRQKQRLPRPKRQNAQPAMPKQEVDGLMAKFGRSTATTPSPDGDRTDRGSVPGLRRPARGPVAVSSSAGRR